MVLKNGNKNVRNLIGEMKKKKRVKVKKTY